MAIGFPACNARALLNLNSARNELVDRIKSAAEQGECYIELSVSAEDTVLNIDRARIVEELRDDDYDVSLCYNMLHVSW